MPAFSATGRFRSRRFFLRFFLFCSSVFEEEKGEMTNQFADVSQFLSLKGNLVLFEYFMVSEKINYSKPVFGEKKREKLVLMR